MPHSKRAVVIGAGFGGIAAALRLAAMGHAVTLVERTNALGGRASVWQHDGYTFDMGPTVITAPHLFEELFTLFDEEMADHVSIRPLSPWYRYESLARGDEHFVLDYDAGDDVMRERVAAISPGDVAGFEALRAEASAIYELGFEQLADVPFEGLADLLRHTPDILRLGGYRSVYGAVSRRLKHPMLRRAFSLQPLLVGGNPLTTTSIYLLIHELERRFGVHYAEGGMGQLVHALKKLLQRAGVEVLTGADVTAVTSLSRRVTGVRLAGGTHLSADIVVSNADPTTLYGKLIPAAERAYWTDARLSRMRQSMSVFVLFLGVRPHTGASPDPYDQLAHHTILLAEKYEEPLRQLFGSLFRTPHMPDDVNIYLHNPSATDLTLAPEGHRALYALTPVPNLQADIDWQTAGPKLAERIIDELQASVLPDLRERLTYAHHIGPHDFARQHRSEVGAAFSIQPLLTQSASLRFGNRSEELDGLYLVGSGTHPGAGLPGVLSSAKVVERQLRKDA